MKIGQLAQPSSASFRRAVFAVSLSFLVGASTATTLASHDYPPRISYIEGNAAYESAGNVDWDEVTLNLPLQLGDRVFLHPDSRLEVELGEANFLRMGAETDVVFSQLSDDWTSLALHQGDLILRVNHSDRFRVSTPFARVEVKKKGLYRIRVDTDGTTQIFVRKGQAEVEDQNGKHKVKSDEQWSIGDSQFDPQNIRYEYHEDDFDLWSDRRDASFVRSHSISHVGGVYYPGIYDLDLYGNWVDYSPYGQVWVPHVSIGWAPFRLGRWGYLSFGWTWVSHEPWGWLPYHYGHWIYHRPHHRWAWVPGRFHNWSPALVNFYSGTGYIGWVPRRYSNSPNRIINNTLVIHNWNRRDPSTGLTVVRQEHFGRGRRHIDHVVTPPRGIVSTFRQGLPRELEQPVLRWQGNPAGRSDLLRRDLEKRTQSGHRQTNTLKSQPRIRASASSSARTRPRISRLTPRTSPRVESIPARQSPEKTLGNRPKPSSSLSSDRGFSRRLSTVRPPTRPRLKSVINPSSSRIPRRAPSVSRPSPRPSQRPRSSTPSLSRPTVRPKFRSIFRSTTRPSARPKISRPSRSSPRPSIQRSAPRNSPTISRQRPNRGRN